MHGVPNVVCGEVKIIEVQESKKLYFAECLLLTLGKDTLWRVLHLYTRQRAEGGRLV
jgi:hypothetical protein